LCHRGRGANLHLADLKIAAGDFDPMTRDRFLAGALVPAAWCSKPAVPPVVSPAGAGGVRRHRHPLGAGDALSAPLIGQETIEIDGAMVPARPYLGVYTQPLSFIACRSWPRRYRKPGETPQGCASLGAAQVTPPRSTPRQCAARRLRARRGDDLHADWHSPGFVTARPRTGRPMNDSGWV